MFCPECGRQAVLNARFCSNCGNPLAVNASAQASAPAPSDTLTVACYIREGFLGKYPTVLWLDPVTCAFINIGDAHYRSVTAGAACVQHPRQREKAMALAFHQFAQSLGQYPLSELVGAHPGSIVFENAAIRSFRCEETYDEDFHKHWDYILFVVYAVTQKIRGCFERDLRLSAIEPMLRACYQNRYHFKTVNFQLCPDPKIRNLPRQVPDFIQQVFLTDAF